MHNLSSKIEPHIIEIVQELQSCGYETYLVGGAVRDLLINKTPKDYDISTAATPEKVRGIFGKRHTRIIGKRFRIVHLNYYSKIVEISTFRKAPDLSQQKQIKQHPEHPHHQHHKTAHVITNDNEYGTSYEDAWRRDFTVNAIFYDPVKNKIEDFTEHGLEDLKARIVRTIGQPFVRFSEDPVRMLRALKLVGQYGFKLERETESVLVSLMNHIVAASNSRLSLELEKILSKPFIDKIFKVFYEYGFLIFFLPNLAKEWATPEQNLAMDILHTRCKRIVEKNVSSHITISIAALALPFVNKYYNNTENTTYIREYTQSDKHQVRNIIVHLLKPYSFPKQIISTAADAIVLQHRIYNSIRINRLAKHPGFKAARELALVLNDLYWHKEDLEQLLFPQKYRKK